MKNNLILLLIILLISTVKGQSIDFNLTGNLQADSKILFDAQEVDITPQLTFQVENKKSPFLAGLMSLVIPGSGEFYSGSYWKTAVFVALEAAVITVAVIYDNKGDDQTEKFENYADQNWSVVDYATWLNNRGASITINPNESLQPWQRVNWTELNNAETGHHKLPQYGDQQYYELIGKYHQYSPGWNDYAGGDNTSTLSPNFQFYSHERGKANDFYTVASTAVIGIYINHFLSAIDAVWSTVNYNKSLAVTMRVEQAQYANDIELVPTLKLSYNF